MGTQLTKSVVLVLTRPCKQRSSMGDLKGDMVLDHLLYETVLCLTGWSSGNAVQCAYLEAH